MSQYVQNPYYCYPRYPICGYKDIEMYNSELMRLNREIVELSSLMHSNMLFHMSIGSAYEEYHDSTKETIEYQWQQLCPVHVREAVLKHIKTVHFIISPSEHINFDREPSFISKTPEFDWEHPDPHTYKSRTYDFVVKTFYCPMPSKCKQYDVILEKLKSRPEFASVSDMVVRQTHGDVEFIDSFYTNLSYLFNNVVASDGWVSCFSFAVFNEDSDNYKYNHYQLFSEIVKLFPEDDWNSTRRLLARWIFRINDCQMYVFDNHKKQRAVVSYTKDMLWFKENKHSIMSLYAIFAHLQKINEVDVIMKMRGYTGFNDNTICPDLENRVDILAKVYGVTIYVKNDTSVYFVSKHGERQLNIFTNDELINQHYFNGGNIMNS